MLLTDSVNQEYGQQTWFASLSMTYQDSNVRGLESHECYFTQLSEAGRGCTMSGSDETVKQSVHTCRYSFSFSKHIKQGGSWMDFTTYLHPKITQFSTLPQFFFLLSQYPTVTFSKQIKRFYILCILILLTCLKKNDTLTCNKKKKNFFLIF